MQFLCKTCKRAIKSPGQEWQHVSEVAYLIAEMRQKKAKRKIVYAKCDTCFRK